MKHGEPFDSGECDEWLSPRRFALGLALLLGALFWKVLFGEESFFYRDYGSLAYPFAFFHHEAIWRGELPQWNPLIHCGVPFLAQWGTMILYPGALIYALLPLPWSLGFFCIAHLWLAGMGMYFLAHRLTSDRRAAAFAGVAFALGGAMLSSLIYPNYTVALGWMPWVVLGVERACSEGKRWIVLGAFFGALQMLSGAPEIILLTWIIAIALALAGCQRDEWVRQLLRYGTVVVLVAGLTAVQLLPFLDLLAHSQRDSNFAGTFWSMPAWGWVNLLVPLFHSFMTEQGMFVQAGQSFLTSYYPGVVVVALALASVVQMRDRLVMALGVVAVVSLVLALGEHGFVLPWLKKCFPALGFARYPIKLVFAATFALPLLAALTLASLMKPNGASAGAGRWVWIAGRGTLLCIAVAVSWSLMYPISGAEWPAVGFNGALRAVILVSVLVGLSWLFRGASPFAWRVGFVALLVLVGVDLWTAVPRQVVSIPAWAFTSGLVRQKLELQPPPEAGKSRVMLSPYAESILLTRTVTNQLNGFLGERMALWYNHNLLDAIPKVGGAATLLLREESEMERLIYSRKEADLSGLMDFLGVSHVTSASNVVDWAARPASWSMSWAGDHPKFATAEETLAALQSTEFRPDKIVYLPPEAHGRVSVEPRGVWKCELRHFSNSRVEYDVETGGPRLLVVAQTFAPSWRATVDGKSVPIHRANHAFQAVEVPVGKHTVEFVYKERTLVVGTAISVLTGVACSIFLRRTRNNSPVV